MKSPTATKTPKLPVRRETRPVMSDAQRAEALRLVQTQAEERVELGVKLLNAAKEHIGKYQEQVDAVRTEQQRFQERIEHDVTTSFRQYDQWIELVESTTGDRMARMEAKLDAIEAEWAHAQEKIVAFVLRAESLVDQSRRLMEITQAMHADQLMQQVERARQTPPVDDAKYDAREVTAVVDTEPTQTVEEREAVDAHEVDAHDVDATVVDAREVESLVDPEPIRVAVRVATKPFADESERREEPAGKTNVAKVETTVAPKAAPATSPVEDTSVQEMTTADETVTQVTTPADEEPAPVIPPEPQIKRSQTSLIYSALLERLAARARAEQKSQT